VTKKCRIYLIEMVMELLNLSINNRIKNLYLVMPKVWLIGFFVVYAYWHNPHAYFPFECDVRRRISMPSSSQNKYTFFWSEFHPFSLRFCSSFLVDFTHNMAFKIS
jgi:hypothetical protein